MNPIHQIFAQWPESIPVKASVLTAFGELIPFNDYLLNGDLILLIRALPDAQGTRRSVINVSEIKALKFQEAIAPDTFSAMGFQRPSKPVAQRPAAGPPVIRGPV